MTDNSAFDLIGLTKLRNDPEFKNIDGSGFSVAVIDTEIDFENPLLERNYLTGIDFVDSDNNPSDNISHGTDVAGIIGSLDRNVGVAPDVDIISLDTVSVFDSDNDCSKEERQSFRKEDINESLEWVLDNHEEYNIVAVNMSFGGGFFTSEDQIYRQLDIAYEELSSLDRLVEDSDDFYSEFKTEIELKKDEIESSISVWESEVRRIELIRNLEDADIVVVAGSGNSYVSRSHPCFDILNPNERPNLASPSIYATLAVGSVWHSDRANFSNNYIQEPGKDRIAFSSQRLNSDNFIFAPGVGINSTYSEDNSDFVNGTSFASPHVAGSVALLQEAANKFGDRKLTPDEIVDILRSTADIVFDGDDENDDLYFSDDERYEIYNDIENTNVYYPRLNIYNAVVEVKRRFEEDDFSEDIAIDNSIENIRVGERFSNNIGTDDGVILDRGDVDFYSFIPPQDGVVNFQAISNNKFNTDTFLRLFDSVGKEIAFNNDARNTKGSLIQQEVNANVEYRIGITGSSSSYDPFTGEGVISDSQGNYTFTVIE